MRNRDHELAAPLPVEQRTSVGRRPLARIGAGEAAAPAGLRTTRWLRGRRLDVLLTTAAVLLVSAPLLFTDSGFELDFTNHLWLVWAAGKELAWSGHPTYFINTEGLGVFYPYFAFYGGTLYMIVGALSELLAGHAAIAYPAVITLTVAASYIGTLWLARQLGLRGWIAHAPALTVVTSAYYITNLYGRGAWTELTATAAIPPLAASGLYLVRAPRWRVGPVLVFVVSAVVLTGSHNITLVWGTTMLALTLVLIWLAFGAPRRLPYRRLGMVAGLALTSVLVNAWFLAPDIVYEHNVVAGGTVGGAIGVIWGETSFFNVPAVLLDPLRHVPFQSTTPALFVQAPDWFLVWGLVAGPLLLWRGSVAPRLRRVWIAVTALVALVLIMIMAQPFWEVVPFPLDGIQFPYRLGSYLYYGVAGLVLVGALGLQRAAAAGPRTATAGPRTAVTGLRIGLIAATAISVGLCVWQIWVPNTSGGIPTTSEGSYPKRGEALTSVNSLPHSWYDTGSYLDVQAPLVTVPEGRQLLIEPGEVKGDRYEAWLNAPAGTQPILTNIGAGAYLAHISGGVERMGRYGQGPRTYVVVRRVHGGSGPVHVVVETTHSFLLELGWALSVLATLTILALLTVLGVRSMRIRRAASAPPPINDG